MAVVSSQVVLHSHELMSSKSSFSLSKAMSDFKKCFVSAAAVIVSVSYLTSLSVASTVEDSTQHAAFFAF